MVAAGVIEIGIEDELVGVAPEVRDRLATYIADVTSGLVRPEQRRNAELYARGLIEAGARKSLEPIVARLGGGKVEYEALQHFLADSPWDPGVVDRAVAERVCAVIEPEAWCWTTPGSPRTASTRDDRPRGASVGPPDLRQSGSALTAIQASPVLAMRAAV